MYKKIFEKLEICACGTKPQITVDRKNSRFSVVCNFCQYEARAENADDAAELWNRVIYVPTESEIELRFNPYHEPQTGRFTSKGEAVDLTGSKSSGKIKSQKIGKKEYTRICHEIATNFPMLKDDGTVYECFNRNHYYRFTVIEPGRYAFNLKIKISGNETKIEMMRSKFKDE